MTSPASSPALLNAYFKDVVRLQRSGVGVPETSYYGSLERLLSGVGKSCSPEIAAVMHPGNVGAGIPDGGLFSAHQLSRAGGKQSAFDRQLPTHGVVEAKPLESDLDKIADTQQIKKYLLRYGKVLLTNFREFALWTQTPQGPVKGESFALAGTTEEFLALRAADLESVSSRFFDYLRRVILSGAPISRSEDLAAFLAAYAKQALDRVEKGNLKALEPLRKALSDALGVTFSGDRQAKFFRSTLVQTIFYGVFSAWVFWSAENKNKDERFDWRTASWFLNVPVVRALFDQVANASRLRPLHLDELLDWAGECLNQVDREAFFANFETDDAVLYFYEPFLAEFDPELRRQLGIWYTPSEVVKYMVDRVDAVLREELGCPNGFADERVWVLDPCVGTGSFLLEVLRKIHATRLETEGDSLAGFDVREAAIRRIIGFEILPAPFVVAHLQIGMLLRRMGAPLDADTEQRASVYLTNALTGWAKEQQQAISLPELADERDAASQVKQKAPILVVLGNPPYNAFAGVSPAEEGGLVSIYKEGLKKWGITRNNVDDLYVRFLRLAERRVTEMQGEGVVSLISNFSYLGDPSLVLVRERILAEFDSIWLDNLNGDSRETGKKTPDGRSDPSVFSTPRNREGISVGTAIGTFVRRQERSTVPSVLYRDFWGPAKREDLVASLGETQPGYQEILPLEDTAYSFRPQRLHDEYLKWARVDELSHVAPMPGLLEKRGGGLIDADREVLEARIQRFLDPTLSVEELGETIRGLAASWAGYIPEKVRERLIDAGGFKSDHVRRYLSRAFETHWAYLEPTPPLWNRARPDLQEAAEVDCEFFLARRRVPRALDGAAFYLSKHIGDDHVLHKNAYYIPTRRFGAEFSKSDGDQQSLFADMAADQESGTLANLSSKAREWLAGLSIGNPDANRAVGDMPWLHALAVGYSSEYLNENRDGGRFHFQRVPLPTSADGLSRGASLGRKVAELLDLDTTPSPELHESELKLRPVVGAIGTSDSSPLTAEDFSLVAWAIVQPGKVMPYEGRTTKRSWLSDERNALLAAGAGLGVAAETALSCLGDAVDVHLNERAIWRGVPSAVWKYKVGGHTVLRKWLSYRDRRVLERPLSTAEIRQFSMIVRRLTLLVLLSDGLDRHYQETRDASYSWRTTISRPDVDS
ncbi:type ISP restriction/modification enzyme [Streptomyces triticirhizae]|nr:type ISP restriction/modification enzyme [Streptomyces triticirhizae]